MCGSEEKVPTREDEKTDDHDDISRKAKCSRAVKGCICTSNTCTDHVTIPDGITNVEGHYCETTSPLPLPTTTPQDMQLASYRRQNLLLE